MSGASYTDTFQYVINKLEILLKDYKDSNLGSIHYAKLETGTIVENAKPGYDALKASEQISQEKTNETPLKKVASDNTISESDVEKSPSASPDVTEEPKTNVHLDLSKVPHVITHSKVPPSSTLLAAPPPKPQVIESVAELLIVATNNTEAKTDESEHLAPRKPDLKNQSFTNALIWRVSSLLVNNELKAEKVYTFNNLIEDMHLHMSNKNIFTKLPPFKKATAADNTTRTKELEKLSTTIDLLAKYVAKADVHIRGQRGSAPPRRADALLRVLSDILVWLKEDSIIKLLHIALGYDSLRGDSNASIELLQNIEKLEASYVTDLFKWLFLIKLDEVMHLQYGTPLEVSDVISEKLMRNFKKSINFVYIQSFHTPNESQRIEILLNNIEAKQHICTTLGITHGVLPTFISSMIWNEQFLQKLPREMNEYESRINKLDLSLQERDGKEEIQKILQRPTLKLGGQST